MTARPVLRLVLPVRPPAGASLPEAATRRLLVYRNGPGHHRRALRGAAVTGRAAPELVGAARRSLPVAGGIPRVSALPVFVTD